MFNKSSQKPLTVELMDISQQNKAILQFFISGVGRDVFRMAGSANEVEAYIIDYDFPGARAHWEAEYADSNRPQIILATNDPQVENSVWIAKPLSSKNLIKAAATIRQIIKDNPLPAVQAEENQDDGDEEVIPEKPAITQSLIGAKKKSFVKPTKENPAVSKPSLTLVTEETSDTTKLADSSVQVHIEDSKQAESEDAAQQSDQISAPEIEKSEPKTEQQFKQEAEQIEKRWIALCGNREDSTVIADNMRYSPDNYLIGKLMGAVRLAKQSGQIVEIKIKPNSIFILPNEFQVFTEKPLDEEFNDLLRTEINTGEMNLHILSSIETGKLQMKMSEQPENIHGLETYLWTSSLVTSQGKLPISVDSDKRIALKYWPSFARVEAFPYSMRIAALWHSSPGSLMEISKQLDIPQRYVFAFYNAANALDLIERDPKRVKQQMKAKPKKAGGIISRLFKRLLKGGSTPS